jgi:hypothetical protein
LEEAGLFVIIVGEIEQEAVIFAERAVEPERSSEKLFAEEDESENQV